MRFLRKAAGVFVGLVALSCFLYIGTWALVQTRQFRSWVEASARDAGIELHLEKIALVFPFGLVVSSADATLPDGLHFTCREIRADVNPFALIFGRLNELTLVQPRIRVRLSSSAQGGEAFTINLLLRSFIVEDGQVEIETGEGKTIAIPRIELSGENLNLGSQSGELETVAFVPELNGELKIGLRATPAAIKARFELVQQQSPGKRGTPDSHIPKSRGELALHFEQDSTLRLTGNASLDRLTFSSIGYTGNLKVSAETDAKRETVAIDLESDTTQIAGLAAAGDASQTFPLSSTITGHYATKDNQLALTAIRVSSPMGKLLGKAALSFGKEPQLTRAVLEIRDVRLAPLQRLLPEASGRALGDINGNFSAKLTVTGQLTPWSFSGIIETTATQITARDANITQIKGTIPFAIRAGNFESTGLRLDAEKLKWKAPSHALDTGIVSLGIKGDVRAASKGRSFNGTMEIQGGRFATDDGLSAADNIGGKASIQVVLQAEGLERAQLDVKLNSMEFLWHRFFADFKPEEPHLNLSASYNSRTETLEIESGRFGLRNMGDVVFNGQLKELTNDPVFELRIDTQRIRLTNLFDFFIRETFKTSHPLLGNLQLAGSAGAETMLRGSVAKFSVQGTAQLQGTEIIRPDHWSIGPLEVTLPFKIEYPKRATLETATNLPRAGLAVRSVKLGDSEVPPFTVFLSLWDNALTLVKPLQISLYGGALIVERLAWQDIIASPRKFSFSARINEISLASMTKQHGWYEFNGSLSGVIPQITWAEDTLRTDGELELRVFDGEVKLDDLEVARLGGYLPAIKGNVTLRGIDLGKATKAFEFGSISGILQGEIAGLVIAGNQPSQFRANLETVEAKGVSQWISVEALNKITILSSGAQGNALYGTLAGFFDSYRYRKLGFKAQLRNDLLILQGIKSQDGKEFLVEGSLIPPTVNIISHTQRIGFKELMKRLERIQQTGPTQAPIIQ